MSWVASWIGGYCSKVPVSQAQRNYGAGGRTSIVKAFGTFKGLPAMVAGEAL